MRSAQRSDFGLFSCGIHDSLLDLTLLSYLDFRSIR